MAAQKHKILPETFCIFECLMPIFTPKSFESKLPTLLILPDQLEDYHNIQRQKAFGD